jgi:hypothetical protein
MTRDIVTARPSCELCGRSGNCSVNLRNRFRHCRHIKAGACPPGWIYKGTDATGAEMFVREEDSAEFDYQDPRDRKFREWQRQMQQAQRELERDTRPVITGESRFERVRDNLRDLRPTERNRLASELCLPLGIFEELGVKFLEAGWDSGGDAAFVTPEVNGDGGVVGYNLRHYFEPKEKRSAGSRGMYAPRSFGAMTGPILIPEGMSDTLHLVAMNVASVGRFSKDGGADYIVRHLRRHGLAEQVGRPIIFLIENDQKFEDQRWPGREGTEKIAKAIARELGRPVWMATMPAGYKDVRDYVTTHAGRVRSGETTLQILGESLLEHVLTNREIVGPLDLTPAMKDLPAESAPLHGPPSPARPVEDRGPTWCPRAGCAVMRDDIHQLSRPVFPCCKTLACEFCRPRKIAHYRATIGFHLRRHAEAGATAVYAWRVVRAQWKSVSRSIGCYFSIDLGDGARFVVSEREPRLRSDERPDAIASLTELSPEDAIARLSSIIAMLPVHGATFSSSHRWKLIPDRIEAAKPIAPDGIEYAWRRVGKSAASRQRVAQILAAHGIDNHAWEAFTVPGRWWGYAAIQIPDSALPPGLTADHLIGDIMLGEATPICELVWTTPSSLVDRTTGPPGMPQFAVPLPY